MTVEDAIIELQRRGLRLASLRQDVDGLWIALVEVREPHSFVGRDKFAASAIMNAVASMPRLADA
jgi:hypothetical protein